MTQQETIIRTKYHELTKETATKNCNKVISPKFVYFMENTPKKIETKLPYKHLIWVRVQCQQNETKAIDRKNGISVLFWNRMTFECLKPDDFVNKKKEMSRLWMVLFYLDLECPI